MTRDWDKVFKEAVVKLAIEELTVDAFAPFGQVFQAQERAADGSGPGWKWWAGIALLPGEEQPYMVGYLDLQPAELRFDWAERHMRSVEVLIPAGGDCLVYVGPPDFLEEPGRMPPLQSFRVFRIPQGQAVLLSKGVWHGAPLAVDQPLNVFVLLLNKTGDNDLNLVRFPDSPVEIYR
jgi:ureidoglycolate hydrolase